MISALVLCTLPTILVVLIATTLLLRKVRDWKGRAPPGPRGLPVIGHLHMLGKLPHQALYKLSQAYGPLISMRLGSLPILVASTPDMAQQVLQTHDLAFAARPRTASTLHITQGGCDIFFSQPDHYWCLKRQLCVTHLFSNKRLQSLKWMREAEVGDLLRSILAKDSNGHPIVVRPKLMDASNNIISRMVLGKRRQASEGSNYGGRSLISLLNQAIDLITVPNMGDYIPFLAWMDLQGCTKRSKIVAEKIHIALQAIIDERRNNKHPMMDDEEKHDLLQVMLGVSSSHVELTDSHIMGVLMNMFSAGTDTTAYTVEWALASLMCNPKKMERAQAEIDEVVGKARRVQEDDIPQLPYLQAVVKEAMRLYPVAPLLVPHVAREACRVAGFHIRAGTQAYVNVWAIGRDADWWEKPLEFMPERFLQDNTRSVDMRGLHFQLLPFGSGRRGCPGLSLGLVSVHTMLASLLHGFEWTTPTKLDMSEMFNTLLMMASPLTAIPSPRLPAHCYTL